MTTTRRKFLQLSAAISSTVVLSAGESGSNSNVKPRAIFFDALTTFDQKPTVARLEQVFPGRGSELGKAWRTLQFEYAWLRSLGAQYEGFFKVTQDALIAACRTLKIEMSERQRSEVMQCFLELKAYPDVGPVLRRFRAASIRVALLSNFTEEMMKAGLKNSGLEGAFDDLLSTDRVRAYKPSPVAYAMGTERFGLHGKDCVFAAFAGWDVAGAKWFGYPTFWVNRNGLPAEELGVIPDGAGRDFEDLAKFVLKKG
jgi:2-haloacid dehalogenase